jgi:UDP-galactopyranose mutase
MTEPKYLIVGCGLSGCVIAERIANVLNQDVLIIDKRDHIGGNCYDYIDEETGIRVHKYGSHLFHTNIKRVWDYVNKFTTWERWEHKVLSYIDDKFVPIPANITTVNMLCNENIQTEEEMKEWLENNQVKYDNITNSEEMAKSRIGEDLYEKMVKHYTYKQWNKYPNELDKSVLARIPVRNDFDTRYFKDKYQALPKYGYTHLFENILNNNRISVKLNCDFFEYKKNNDLSDKIIIYTGPIDHYFGSQGMPKLEYRSIDFKIERFNFPYYQPNSAVNYPENNVPYTRIIEYKHFLNQKSDKTIIVSETTNDNGEPFYPVPNERNLSLFEKYKELADKEENVYFVGRLANYKYFNMDQAIDNSLSFFDKIMKENMI